MSDHVSGLCCLASVISNLFSYWVKSLRFLVSSWLIVSASRYDLSLIMTSLNSWSPSLINWSDKIYVLCHKELFEISWRFRLATGREWQFQEVSKICPNVSLTRETSDKFLGWQDECQMTLRALLSRVLSRCQGQSTPRTVLNIAGLNTR